MPLAPHTGMPHMMPERPLMREGEMMRQGALGIRLLGHARLHRDKANHADPGHNLRKRTGKRLKPAPASRIFGLMAHKIFVSTPALRQNLAPPAVIDDLVGPE